MTIQIELSSQAEATLAAAALAHGLAPEQYAGALLQRALTPSSDTSAGMSVDQFHAMLDALAVGSEGLPDLATESFSRESFYEGRA